MAPPTEIQLLVKTHKTAIFLTTPFTATLPDVKADTLSALQQFAGSTPDPDSFPVIQSESEFELCKKETSRGGIVSYVELERGKTVKQMGLVNWQVLYIRFRDESGTLLEVNVTEPSIEEEDEEELMPIDTASKGKGKANV